MAQKVTKSRIFIPILAKIIFKSITTGPVRAGEDDAGEAEVVVSHSLLYGFCDHFRAVRMVLGD